MSHGIIRYEKKLVLFFGRCSINVSIKFENYGSGRVLSEPILKNLNISVLYLAKKYSKCFKILIMIALHLYYNIL